jgi:hypothetical protein
MESTVLKIRLSVRSAPRLLDATSSYHSGNNFLPIFKPALARSRSPTQPAISSCYNPQPKLVSVYCHRGDPDMYSREF